MKIKTYVISVQYGKEYESVRREKTLGLPLRTVMNARLINVTASLYNGVNTSIQVGEEELTPAVTSGIPQGWTHRLDPLPCLN